MRESEILRMFYKKKNKVDILWEALDYMQQYGGRSRVQCIGLAMGLSQKVAYDEEVKDAIHNTDGGKVGK